MSAEEDTELRDLVIQSLENNGVLAKIKAQLRASIFLSLEEENSVQNKTPFLNKSVKSCLESSNGRLLFLLVREFLEFFNLQHTISVFEPESYLNSLVEYQGREKLIEELGVKVSKDNLKGPILLYLLETIKNISVNKTDNNENFMRNESNQSVDTSSPNFSEGREDVSIHSLSLESEISISNTLKPITAIQTVKKKINAINKEESDFSEKSDIKSINGDLNTFEKEKLAISDELTSLKTNHKYILNNDNSSQSNICSNENHSNVLSENVIESNTMFTPELLIKAEIEENDRMSENQGKSSNIHAQDLTKSKSSFISTERLKSISNTEKFKPLSTLSSLHDLPPLTLNKTRTDTILLPSLYSKEFKSPRGETLFDLETDSLDNYEEDIMAQNENYIQSKNNT